MRMPRIKASKGTDGLYHCMSRIVGGDYLLGPQEKETFVQLMWKVAAFLGIEVLDYVVMSNHYHQLVRVPGVIDLSDAELLARVRSYYGEATEEARSLEVAFEKGGEVAAFHRNRYLQRMGNVSEFEKILKQGFSRWYNQRKERCGTLWMERFKSLLVEDSLSSREIIATYIDLNPVRAEMVNDPKNYRHCGYAAALAGDERCRAGIMWIMGMDTWQKAVADYRMCLMERGHIRVKGKTGVVSRELLLETLDKRGHLTKSELVHLRVRYFSDGLVLGSETFVNETFNRCRHYFGKNRKSGARAINVLQDRSLNVLRDLRMTTIS